MTNDTLAQGARAAHDWGLASFLGGTMFGQLAMNPAVSQISDRSERGKVANAAWSGYNLVNLVSLAAVAGGWASARLTEAAPPRLSDRERSLAKAKDALTLAALGSGVVSAVQGARLANAQPNGAVPIERGLKPAPETPAAAASAQKALRLSGTLSILAGAGLVVTNAIMAQLAHTRPPLRRGLLRRAA